MKPIDVVIIAQYSGDGANSNNRFREIAKNFLARTDKVELVTSSFIHSGKKQADPSADKNAPYKVTRIKEPGYRTNITLSRITSHRQLARNVRIYLESRATPDLIYCALPSISVATAAMEYAKDKGIPFVLDIQDLWPESFEMVLKPKPLARVLFYPLRRQVNKIYRQADKVVGISHTFVEVANSVRDREGSTKAVYLGTNLSQFDEFKEQETEDIKATPNSIGYVGTLGHSYNLPVVFEAIRELNKENISATLHIMGDGPMMDTWIEQTQDIRQQVIFYGRLPYPEMVRRLCACSIAVNPIIDSSAASVINKVGDYAAAGLPVVNTQKSPEYRALISTTNSGINCENEAADVAKAIRRLLEEDSLRAEMGNNSRMLAETHFDRATTYPALIDWVLEEI